MFSYALIPFVLVLNMYVEEELDVNLPMEYVFSFNKTTAIPIGTFKSTQITAKLVCQMPSLNYPILRCFLQDVMVLNLMYQDLNNAEQLPKEVVKLDQTPWFELSFDQYGVKENIRVKKGYKKVILDIIKDIAYQFKVDSSDELGLAKKLTMKSTSGSSVFLATERTLVGSCTFIYNMTVVFNEKDDGSSSIFQIIPAVIQKYSTKKKDIHVQIKKDKLGCLPSRQSDKYLMGNVIGKYIYNMEMVNSKLKMFTTMDVKVPLNRGRISGLLLFTKTASLDLIDVRDRQSEQLSDWNDPYKWTTISIY